MDGAKRDFPVAAPELFDATCSACAKATRVPFKPTPGRPVYCRDCFAKHRPTRD